MSTQAPCRTECRDEEAMERAFAERTARLEQALRDAHEAQEQALATIEGLARELGFPLSRSLRTERARWPEGADGR